jgi:hypothetical protein
MMILSPSRFGAGGGGGGSDPYFANVVLLTNFSGGSATDLKGHTINLTNGAAVNTSNPEPSGTHSLALDGDNDYASSPDSADWDFGTGDFTIEYDVYHDDFTAAASGGGTNQCAISRGLGAWAALVGTGAILGRILWWVGGSIGSTTVAMTVAAWNHIAISRVSGTLRIFVNGVKGFEYAAGTDFSYATALVLGASDVTPFGNLDGNVGNYRITKGVGRYTADFAVPSRPYPQS